MSQTTRSPRSASHARSWRSKVADALARARTAVELDSKNTDPEGALAAYADSVRRLRSILSRVERHGALNEASKLTAICDQYSERMRVLSVACNVPPPPYEDLSEGGDRSSASASLIPPVPPLPPPAYLESGLASPQEKSPRTNSCDTFGAQA
ncbi:hypothetical protein BC834DRAFT_972349 [Gloeopeniophorella convolvens]|nr:hypothetical protein BC834DRAFT_972349 [Gloeopeniophorella convolvens]